ncbi:MAG: InlB B-repeat-containing protein, partial [Actinomycetota bacterium]
MLRRTGFAALFVLATLVAGTLAAIPASAAANPTLSVTIASSNGGSGRVTSSPAAISCPGTCSGSFVKGTVFTLTATPSTGSSFANWSGACSGSSTTCTITLSATMKVTANFSLNRYALSVAKNGSGTGTVTSSPTGISCGTTCSATFFYPTSVTLTAAAASGSVFTGWSGACTNPSGTCSVTMSQARNVTATFQLIRTLSVTKSGSGTGAVASSPAGINCGATCSAGFADGTSVTLTATPGASSAFSTWSGACSGSATSCVVAMTAARSVTATFVPTFVLTVGRAGNGSGSVSSSPAGIACPPTCSAPFPQGTAVILTGSPATGSSVTAWSVGTCTATSTTCSVTVNAAVSASVTFTLVKHALTVTRIGNGTGSVAASPGPLCGLECGTLYDYGTSVILTPTAGTGSYFDGWGGACSGTGGCTVVVTAPTSVSAAFTLTRHVLTVVADGTGSGTISSDVGGISCGSTCDATYDYGTTVTLTAIADAGDAFTGWSGGGCTGTGTCAVTVTAATTVTATFRPTNLLTVTFETGNGGGSVASSPDGIDCTDTCAAPFPDTTTVTLTATPDTGSEVAWDGVCLGETGLTCEVPMSEARDVSVTFTLVKVELAIDVVGLGSVDVTAGTSSSACDADCAPVFDYGTSVTLSATPDTGYYFVAWGGDCVVSGADCTISMNGDRTASVTFSPTEMPVELTSDGNGSGSATWSPSVGPDCIDCTVIYDYGDTVTITADPDTGSHLAGWGGDCVVDPLVPDVCVIAVRRAMSATVTYTLDVHTLSFAKLGVGAGSVISGDGRIVCGADCTSTSESYNYGSPVSLAAANAVGSRFKGWSGACSGLGSCDLTVTGETAVAATFTKIWTISAARTGSGTGSVASGDGRIACPSTCSYVYEDGDQITFSATASTGSTFSGWSGPCEGTGVCTVTADAVTTVTATFTINSYDLTVTKAGTGVGTVTSSPAGISCDATCTDQTAQFTHGTTVVLSATAPTGSLFTGWSGAGCTGTGPCSIPMTGAASVTATFALSYQLTVSKSGNGTGALTSNPGGISCNNNCTGPASAWYVENTSVTLTAAPATSSNFTGWSGACSNASGTCTVSMSEARTVTATFELKTFALALTVAGTGAGTVTFSPAVAGTPCTETCAPIYTYGTNVTLTATPSPDAPLSTFAGWSNGCTGT